MEHKEKCNIFSEAHSTLVQYFTSSLPMIGEVMYEHLVVFSWHIFFASANSIPEFVLEIKRRLRISDKQQCRDVIQVKKKTCCRSGIVDTIIREFKSHETFRSSVYQMTKFWNDILGVWSLLNELNVLYRRSKTCLLQAKIEGISNTGLEELFEFSLVPQHWL